MSFYETLPSPLGELRLTSDGEHLTGLYFENHARPPKPVADPQHDPGPFRRVASQLDAYFSGHLRAFDVAIAPAGTEFQRAVWSALRRIEYGCTLTYAQIAAHIDRPQAVRAVGAAIGMNPISIIVPCHRVIGSSGSLTGFAGGVERKRWLLEQEGVTVATR